MGCKLRYASDFTTGHTMCWSVLVTGKEVFVFVLCFMFYVLNVNCQFSFCKIAQCATKKYRAGLKQTKMVISKPLHETLSCNKVFEVTHFNV